MRFAGAAIVTAGNGSLINSNQSVIADMETADVTVTLGDPTTWHVYGDLTVANNGAGQLFVVHDGIVAAADYTAWRDSLGRTGAGLAADGDGNGVVDQADYGVWKTHFGNHSGASATVSTSAAVPEPPSALLLHEWAACIVTVVSCSLFRRSNSAHSSA